MRSSAILFNLINPLTSAIEGGLSRFIYLSRFIFSYSILLTIQLYS